MKVSTRTGLPTIAIVGYAEPTRDETPWDDLDTEIWTINEAHLYSETDDLRDDAVPAWLKRWDALFQLHQERDFRRANHPIQHHLPWLQEQKSVEEGGFPIYMQDEYWDIPASTKYPLDDVFRYDRAVRGPEERVVHYYTSTISYLIGLAIHKLVQFRPKGHDCLSDPPFARLEIYGADMAAGTDYFHQKGSAEYWMGKAEAIGIQLWLPEESRLMHAPLYAFDQGQLISQDILEKRLPVLEKAEADALEKLNEAIERKVAAKKAREEDPGPARDKDFTLAFELENKAASLFTAMTNRKLQVEELIHTMRLQHPIFEPGDTDDGMINRGAIDMLVRTIADEEARAIRTRSEVFGKRQHVGEMLNRAHKNGRPTLIKKYQKESVDLLKADIRAIQTVNALSARKVEMMDLQAHCDFNNPFYFEKVENLMRQRREGTLDGKARPKEEEAEK